MKYIQNHVFQLFSTYGNIFPSFYEIYEAQALLLLPFSQTQDFVD